MITFALAVFFLIATPGPGVLSAAGVGASYGYRPGLAYVIGLFLGNNLVALMVISGLAAIMLSVPGMRLGLMAASILYLLYLAARIAFAGARVGFIHPDRPPGVWNGLALQPINPKAYAVNTAFFANFAFVGQSLWVETLVKLAIINAIWLPIHLVWLWAGVSLRQLDLSPSAQRRINIGMAAAMLIVVGLAVATQI